jgi:hypothetical protein
MREACSTPYAPFAKYTVLRYAVRILSFDHRCSSCHASAASTSLRAIVFWLVR